MTAKARLVAGHGCAELTPSVTLDKPIHKGAVLTVWLGVNPDQAGRVHPSTKWKTKQVILVIIE